MKLAKQVLESLNNLKINEAEKTFTIKVNKNGRTWDSRGTLKELIDDHSYTLEVGKNYENIKGNLKINMDPKNIKSLVDNLNKAKNNSAASGYSDTSYSIG